MGPGSPCWLLPALHSPTLPSLGLPALVKVNCSLDLCSPGLCPLPLPPASESGSALLQDISPRFLPEAPRSPTPRPHQHNPEVCLLSMDPAPHTELPSTISTLQIRKQNLRVAVSRPWVLASWGLSPGCLPRAPHSPQATSLPLKSVNAEIWGPWLLRRPPVPGGGCPPGVWRVILPGSNLGGRVPGLENEKQTRQSRRQAQAPRREAFSTDNAGLVRTHLGNGAGTAEPEPPPRGPECPPPG